MYKCTTREKMGVVKGEGNVHTRTSLETLTENTHKQI